MKNLITLVKMQLKEKLNLKALEREKLNLFQLFVNIVFALVKFVAITGVLAILLYLINYLGIFSTVHRTPLSVMSIAFGVMLIASIVSCTAGLTKAIYFSRDNAILLTLPCKPIQVFLSKLIIFFAYELKRNFSFMIPLFFAYYILHGYPVWTYLWIIVCFTLVSLFTVAVGTILSIPAMWISNIFRQNRSLQISSLILLVSGVIVGLFLAISLIPKNLDLLATWPVITMNIQAGLERFTVNFKFYYDLTLMFLGEVYDIIYVSFAPAVTALRFLILLGMTAGCLGIGMLIVLPIFYKMASTPFEYLKKSVKPRKNLVHSRKLTTFFTELTAAIKNPARAFSNVGILISIPLLTFLLNRLFFAMNTDEMGDSMVIAFNVMIILLVALNANTTASSIYSRDGRAAYLIKTQPAKPDILLFSKLMPDALYCIIGLVVTTVILITQSRLGALNSIVLMLGILCIYFAHLMYCAELDLLNPQYEIYATVGASDNNPNETKATLTAFLISFLTAGAAFLLLLDKSEAISTINLGVASLDTVYLKIFLVGLGCMLYRVYLYFSTIKLYYKEN